MVDQNTLVPRAVFIQIDVGVIAALEIERGTVHEIGVDSHRGVAVAYPTGVVHKQADGVDDGVVRVFISLGARQLGQHTRLHQTVIGFQFSQQKRVRRRIDRVAVLRKGLQLKRVRQHNDGVLFVQGGRARLVRIPLARVHPQAQGRHYSYNKKESSHAYFSNNFW